MRAMVVDKGVRRSVPMNFSNVQCGGSEQSQSSRRPLDLCASVMSNACIRREMHVTCRCLGISQLEERPMSGFKGKISGDDLVRSLADHNFAAALQKQHNIPDSEFRALQGQVRLRVYDTVSTLV